MATTPGTTLRPISCKDAPSVSFGTLHRVEPQADGSVKHTVQSMTADKKPVQTSYTVPAVR